MANSLLSVNDLPQIPDIPHHPMGLTFPKRSFGEKNPVLRSFQAAWFNTWSFLHYDEGKDLAYCHICVKGFKERKMKSSTRADHAFVSFCYGFPLAVTRSPMLLQVTKGFCSWKDATRAFKKHQLSDCHREAVEVVVSLPKTCSDIGEQLSEQYSKEKENNRVMLIKILSCVQLLARQGIPIRGDGDDSESNFIQLLKLSGQGDVKMDEWLKKKTDKYTSHDIQNELLKIMAQHVLRSIAVQIQDSRFVTVMIDETTDVCNQEQVTVVFRTVDDKLIVNEEFIGLYSVDSITADVLTAVIKDVMLRLNLAITKLRGQCYDGCSTMSGSRSGVAIRIMEEECRAVYTHCYGHSLNLAASDAIKSSKIMKDALETTHEITKLIKFSPKREAIFRAFKQENDLESNSSSIGIRVLCPTRWTVRADSLFGILENHSALMHTWNEAISVARDTESVKHEYIEFRLR